MKIIANHTIRRGAILAVTMACLLVVGLLAAGMLRQFVMHHRRAEQRQRQMQAFWVGESALSRATAQVAASPDYTGESWQVPAASLGGEFAAVANITVSVAAADPAKRHVTIETHYPRDETNRIIYRRQVDLTLPNTGVAP